MAFWNVVVSSRISFSTEVEAETEDEAREKGWEAWTNCDIGDMEFWDTHVSDVYQD